MSHCDYHPRHFTGIIVNCGNFHRLCIGCMKMMAQNSRGHICPICQGPITDDDIMSSRITEQKLEALIRQLECNANMNQPDPNVRLPLPMELLFETFKFLDTSNQWFLLPLAPAIAICFGPCVLRKLINAKKQERHFLIAQFGTSEQVGQ